MNKIILITLGLLSIITLQAKPGFGFKLVPNALSQILQKASQELEFHGKDSAQFQAALNDAQKLINDGEGIDDKDSLGTSPLIKYGGNPEIAKFLLRNGANIKQKNERGETILHSVAYSLHQPPCETKKNLLLDYLRAGADRNAQNNALENPLTVYLKYINPANQEFAPKITKIFLAPQAVLSLQKTKQPTYFNLFEPGLRAFVKQSIGLDTNLKDSQGKTIIGYINDLKEKAPTNDLKKEWDSILELLNK